MTAVNETNDVDLESKLREKEQLVGVLTKRLEQAAEQLDRMQRTGGDRPGRGVAGLPPEFVEQQAKTLGDLQSAVERFEEAESAERLGRIEQRVNEIRDLISGGAPITASPLATGAMPTVSSTHGESEPAAHDEGGMSAWEAMKAQILTDSDGATPPAESTHDPGEERRDEPTTSPPAAPPQPAAVVEAIDPVDPPEPVDVENADRDALAKAVLERDEYVAHLLSRLRNSEMRTFQPVDWNALADCPEDLRARLEDVQGRLEDATRRAEVELSLERARLSRIESTLEHRGERLEKELVKLGLDDESLDRQHDEEAEKGPRWMRILGLGNDQ